MRSQSFILLTNNKRWNRQDLPNNLTDRRNQQFSFGRRGGEEKEKRQWRETTKQWQQLAFDANVEFLDLAKTFDRLIPTTTTRTSYYDWGLLLEYMMRGGCNENNNKHDCMRLLYFADGINQSIIGWCQVKKIGVTPNDFSIQICHCIDATVCLFVPPYMDGSGGLARMYIWQLLHG